MRVDAPQARTWARPTLAPRECGTCLFILASLLYARISQPPLAVEQLHLLSSTAVRRTTRTLTRARVPATDDSRRDDSDMAEHAQLRLLGMTLGRSALVQRVRNDFMKRRGVSRHRASP